MKTTLITLLLLGATAVAGGAADSKKAAQNSPELLDLGAAVSDSVIAGQTGRQGVAIDELSNTLNSTEASGTVGSNVLTSAATGTNIISDNAFGTVNGVATVIQNSGNQNVIQSSFIMNLSVK